MQDLKTSQSHGLGAECFICGDTPDFYIRVTTTFGFRMAIPVCEYHSDLEDVKALTSMTRITGSPSSITSKFGMKAKSGPYYRSLNGEMTTCSEVEVIRFNKKPRLLVRALSWLGSLFGDRK